MTMKVVYRSRDPRVLAVIESFEAETKAWAEKAAALLAELGFGDRKWMVQRPPDGMRITGITVRDGDRENPPPGWRIIDHAGPALRPNRRLKAGKEAQTRIDQCQPPKHPRARLPGMPGCYFSATAIHFPNLGDLGDGAVYVDWSTRVPELTADLDPKEKKRRGGVDLAIWERVKLSEYYAAVEAAAEPPAGESRAAS